MARWKTTRTTASCRADQPRSTLYRWSGRLLFTERTCDLEALDRTSRRALDLVGVLVHAPVDLEEGYVRCLDNPLAKGCY